MLRRKRTRNLRGFTISELLITLVIMGLVSGFVALIFGPLLSAPGKHQAKVDTIQSAARALYRMQRDIRMTNEFGVFSCQNDSSAPACATPSTTLTASPVVAVITPLLSGNGAEQLDSTSGGPTWTGYQVYWINSSNQLMYSFGSTSGLSSGIDHPESAASANAAVIAALTNSSAQLIAENVAGIGLSEVSSNKLRIVGLKLTTTATESGRTNTASLESDTVARN